MSWTVLQTKEIQQIARCLLIDGNPLLPDFNLPSFEPVKVADELDCTTNKRNPTNYVPVPLSTFRWLELSGWLVSWIVLQIKGIFQTARCLSIRSLLTLWTAVNLSVSRVVRAVASSRFILQFYFTFTNSFSLLLSEVLGIIRNSFVLKVLFSQFNYLVPTDLNNLFTFLLNF